ncbi:hypothetical protein Tsubulata_036522 [Turnera subulata]|uniref:MOM1 alpha-helical domain-containing protein n=1 Tax=Turnera subulata TaxID=218843 RepID=A0A9Q0J6S7_9ROSI|nr:hypothetical protein Tsubulata_036522 [Turnera subulata]
MENNNKSSSIGSSSLNIEEEVTVSSSWRCTAKDSQNPTSETGDVPAERGETPTVVVPASPSRLLDGEEQVLALDMITWRIEKKKRSNIPRRKAGKLDLRFGSGRSYGCLGVKRKKILELQNQPVAKFRKGDGGMKPQGDDSLIVKPMNARSYRVLVDSLLGGPNRIDMPAKRDRLSQEGGACVTSVTGATVSLDVEEIAAENCSPRPEKRQRLTFETEQECCNPSAKPVHELEGISHPIEFVEYWVPVQLSNVQLEQYCEMLLSNSRLLSSHSRDPVNSLNGVIISARKCCDHPYLLDQSLRGIVRKGLPSEEYWDADIRLSGKLLLLEKILMEIKRQGLRALIIFQSIGGSGQLSVGRILEDFVCYRFGEKCYMRIDALDARKRKQAALDVFNDKNSGKFVSLIENRACLSSIKLSSVGTVILFDSDLDPQNDLKALRRITISSQFEQLRVFRLYSCFTVEEIVLVLAKNGEAVDSNISSLHHSICQKLLNWGVSHLFNKLDKFHDCKTSVPGSNIFSEQSFVEDVLSELSIHLVSITSDCSFISKVQSSEGAYVRNTSLIGKKAILAEVSEPSRLWKDLRDKQPQWHFLSGSCSRVRKKVQYLEHPTEFPEVETYAARENNLKIVNNRMRKKSKLMQRKWHHVSEKRKLPGKNFWSKRKDGLSTLHPVANDATGVPEVEVMKSDKRKTHPCGWKKMMSSLKPEILQLCDTLRLPENVKGITLRFLKFILKDYNISWDSDSTLRAFQISLCWTAAALLKHDISHKESLVVARLHLKFDCEKEEALYIYSELQKIKQSFKLQLDKLQIVKNESKCERHSNSNEEAWEAEAPTRVEDARNSKSSGPVQLDLEERKLPVDSGSLSLSNQPIYLENGKMRLLDSKLSASVCPEVEDEEIPTAGAHFDLEEGEIPPDGYLDDLEREIPDGGSLRDLEGDMPTAASLGDLEQSEIPSSCQYPNLLDQQVHVTIQSEPVSEAPAHLEDLEEAEIPCAGSARDLEEPGRPNAGSPRDLVGKQILTGGSLGDSKETEIPISCQSPNRADQLGLVIMQEKLESGTLIDNLTEKLEDSDSSKKLHGENLTTAAVEGKFAGIVPIIIELDKESVGMETDPAGCIKQEDEESSSMHPIVDDVPSSVPSENQSAVRDTCLADSAIKAAGETQSEQHEVIIIDDTEECSSPCAQKDCVGLERAESSGAKQDREVFTPNHDRPPKLAPSGTSSSSSQQDIGTVQRQSSTISTPLPASIVPCLSGQSQSGVHVPTQILGVRDASGQQAQVPRQLHESVLLKNASINDMPVQQFMSRLVGDETYADDFRRTDLQDLDSAAPILASPDDHLLHDNRLISETSVVGCSMSAAALQKEIEKLRKEEEQDLKIHEIAMSHIKSEREKEIKEVSRKYDVLLQEAETAQRQKIIKHHTNFRKILAYKLVADVITLKNSNYKLGGAQVPAYDVIHKLFRNFIQQPTLVPVRGPEEQSVASPLGASVSDVPPTAFSNDCGGPCSSSMAFLPRNIEASSELQAAAPHIFFRSHMSLLAPEPPGVSSGNTVQQFRSWSPTASLMQTQPGLSQLQGSYDIHVPGFGDSLPLYRFPPSYDGSPQNLVLPSYTLNASNQRVSETAGIWDAATPF